MYDFYQEIEDLLKVKKYLDENEINSIIHDLAVQYSKLNKVSYTRSCLMLIDMLNTIKQGQVVVNSYTE
jgi:hypothetical protein